LWQRKRKYLYERAIKMATEKRLIDVDDAVSFLENSLSIINEMDINGNMKESIKWYKEFIKFIKNRPTVDAVNATRCRDCKYFQMNPFDGCEVCTRGCGFVRPDFGCVDGKRKENG
jgi:hypothetical protein